MIKRIVRYKIYIDRAKAYVGYVQFLMLAIILAKQFGIRLGLWGSILVVIGFFLGCLIVGYIDTRLGIREEESRNYNEQNPEIREIVKFVRNGVKNDCGDTRTWSPSAVESDVTAVIPEK